MFKVFKTKTFLFAALFGLVHQLELLGKIPQGTADLLKTLLGVSTVAAARHALDKVGK
jgi:hypothetical protein